MWDGHLIPFVEKKNVAREDATSSEEITRHMDGCVEDRK